MGGLKLTARGPASILALRVRRHSGKSPIHPGQRLAGPDGAIDFLLERRTHRRPRAWVAGFGDKIEVIEPEDLRTAVRDWAERIAADSFQPGFLIAGSDS